MLFMKCEIKLTCAIHNATPVHAAVSTTRGAIAGIHCTSLCFSVLNLQPIGCLACALLRDSAWSNMFSKTPGLKIFQHMTRRCKQSRSAQKQTTPKGITHTYMSKHTNSHMPVCIKSHSKVVVFFFFGKKLILFLFSKDALN